MTEAQFRWACGLDVALRKAGNVSWASPGHGMDARLFIASAEAASGPLCEPGAPVGRRIEAAVRASLDVAQCNTNLGIVLLCAPLAAAAEARADACWPVEELRAALKQCLARLNVDDAQAAYRAIALARPGGLGRADEADVHAPPRIDLRAAMALAAGRDQIARAYTDGHALVFEALLPVLLAGLARGRSLRTAALHSWLAVLSVEPDSHIVRKHGPAVAQIVMNEAQVWRQAADNGAPVEVEAAYAAWDTSLKQRGINPGTSADLLVATGFVAALVHPDVRRAALEGRV